MSEGPQNGIKVFLRLRPTKKPSGFISLDKDDPGRVDFNIPHELASTYVNNSKSAHKFKFDGVIDEDASQDDVFDRVARDAVMNALEGFNATIFAYGQTGSGKTFTMTGGAERYVDRGIIPRSLSLIFAEIEKRSDMQVATHISYLEIYNEAGYDLLDPEHENKGLHELPKVSMLEDDDGNVHLRNLSMHLAGNEEDALNLLFVGDTNRAVSETAMNLQSSRSHCIFTIFLEMRQRGSDVIRRSKLHLVDLAGSERVHKTHSSGILLREAQAINSSLHFLEMVIVALHERKTKGRQHIPYRNSMMTNVLRDSLGGNCKTSMIATISVEKSNTEESVATARFAQRVALVENDALVNEEIDPSMLIKRLKAEVVQLKEELAFFKGERGEDSGDRIDSIERRRLMTIIQEWIANAKQPSSESKEDDDDSEDRGDYLNPGPLTFPRIHACFGILRKLASGQQASFGGASSEQVHELKQQIQQRDNEIAILVNMVKQTQSDGLRDAASDDGSQQEQAARLAWSGKSVPLYSDMIQGVRERQQEDIERRAVPSTNAVAPVPPSHILADKEKSLEFFKNHYPHSQAINENKRLLKEKYGMAKQAGEIVNSSRKEINRIKAEIEQIRASKELQNVVNNDCNSDESKRDPVDQEETERMEDMENHKRVYKENFVSLKDLKKDIERIQLVLENSRVKMHKDFESWYAVVLRQGLGDGREPSRRQSTPLQQQRQQSRQQEPQQSQPQHQQLERADSDDMRVEVSDAPVRRSILPSKFNQGSENSQEPAGPLPIPLTGCQEADDDIMAFYKAKEQLLRRNKLK